MQFDAASPINYLESCRFHNLILSTQPENRISIHFKVLTGAIILSMIGNTPDIIHVVHNVWQSI
jgi:hypothetical protein